LQVREALYQQVHQRAQPAADEDDEEPIGIGAATDEVYDRDRLENLPSDDMRLRRPEFQEPELAKNLELIERLRPIAGELGASVADIAIAWTLAQDGVTAAIVGARRPDQLDRWIGAGNVELSGEQLATIDAALAETGAGTEELPTPPRPSADENVRAAIGAQD